MSRPEPHPFSSSKGPRTPWCLPDSHRNSSTASEHWATRPNSSPWKTPVTGFSTLDLVLKNRTLLISVRRSPDSSRKSSADSVRQCVGVLQLVLEHRRHRLGGV